MTSKLTLSIEKEVIRNAKKYAQSTGRSLSEMVENYLKNVGSQEDTHGELSDRLKSIVGAVKLPPDYDEERELRDYFEKKHL